MTLKDVLPRDLIRMTYDYISYKDDYNEVMNEMKYTRFSVDLNSCDVRYDEFDHELYDYQECYPFHKIAIYWYKKKKEKGERWKPLYKLFEAKAIENGNLCWLSDLSDEDEEEIFNNNIVICTKHYYNIYHNNKLLRPEFDRSFIIPKHKKIIGGWDTEGFKCYNFNSFFFTYHTNEIYN